MIMSAKEIINDFKENYAKVRKLLDEDSKNDPENEPYLSMYKAKEILSNMRVSLKNIIDGEGSIERDKLDAMLGAILLNIGIIDMETEDLTASEKILTEAEEVLAPHSIKPEVVITLLNVYNNHGVLWSNRDEPEKAKTFLLKAKELYESFKCTMQMPVHIENLLTNPDGDVGDFMLMEKAYTLSLFYLAQVFGSLKENLKSAIYCHVTLRRQLQYSDYEPIDWALNSATLSQFFAEQKGFPQSLHHLAASSTILDIYQEKLQVEEEDEAHLARMETFKHRSADVARCWTKYCLLLLSSSKDRLMVDDDQVPDAITGTTIDYCVYLVINVVDLLPTVLIIYSSITCFGINKQNTTTHCTSYYSTQGHKSPPEKRV